MKIKYVDYTTNGYTLNLPEFLIQVWPDCLPIEEWPTYCGAGDGVGDEVVPDTIFGIRICPACLVHDIDWIIADNDWISFQRSNNRLRRNLRSIVQSKTTNVIQRFFALRRCDTYWLAVSTVGWFAFKKNLEDRIVVSDPITHPAVIKKLKRLGVIVNGT